jgi:uncharacterized protein
LVFLITPVTLRLDTRPRVAFHSRNDDFHSWARDQFAQINGPSTTCEAVVAETCFLLARGGHDPAKALALIARCAVRGGMVLGDEIAPVHALVERYDKVPASLADARLVRLNERCCVFILDTDFQSYRRHGRKVIALLCPR